MRDHRKQSSQIIDHPRTFGATHYVLGTLILVSFVLMMMQPPMPQDFAYHDFADKRTFLGIYGFLNVVSNFGFLLVGIGGICACLSIDIGRLRAAWLTLFTGISFIAVGSAYYHFAPGDWSLVWDRLPMTFGFMGLLVALLGEYVDEILGILLVPAAALGATSVIYWYLADDLRLYIWIQALPLMVIIAVILLFRPRYSHQSLLGASLGLYLLAKAAEFYDGDIFAATGETVSGHTLKHLLSSLGCGAIVLMVFRRRRLIP